MTRWINEFIEENQEKWEELDLIRTQENLEIQEKEEEIDLVRAQEKHEEKEKENANNQRGVKRKVDQEITEQEITTTRNKIKITTITNNTEITEITDKEEWLCWRKTQEHEKQENEINPEINNAEKCPEIELKITLKQAKLTDLYKKQQTSKGKQDKITTPSTENVARKQEITGKNKKNQQNTNNISKSKKPNNTDKKTSKKPVVLRKPILPEPKQITSQKPAEDKTSINNKITKFFTKKQQEITPGQNQAPKLPEKPVNKTIILKPPKPKPKPVSSTSTKKTKKYDEEEKTREKTREKQRGYWLKLAENQKSVKNRNQLPVPAPEMRSLQQLYCKDAKSSTRNIVSRPEILEHSKPLESNKQISLKSEITPGNQIRLE